MPQPVPMPPLKIVVVASVYRGPPCFGSASAQNAWIEFTSATSAQSGSWLASVPVRHWSSEVPPVAPRVDGARSSRRRRGWLVHQEDDDQHDHAADAAADLEAAAAAAHREAAAGPPPPPPPRRFDTWLLSSRALGL